MFKHLTIGKSIFLSTILIIALSLLISNILTIRRFSTMHESLVENTSRELNKQIVMNYENYIESIIDTAHFLELETLSKTKTGSEDELKDMYNSAGTIDRNILDIALFSSTGEPVVTGMEPSLYETSPADTDWFQGALKDPSIFNFAAPTTRPQHPANESVITVSRVVNYYDGSTRSEGVLRIDITTDHFERLGEQTNLGDTGHIVFLDLNQDLLFSSDPDCVDNTCESVEIARSIVLGGEDVTMDGKAMVANVNTLGQTRWQIASFVDVDEINDTRQNVLYNLTLILIITVVVASFTSAFTARRISNPINSLKNHMRLFEKGKFNEKTPVRGQKEVVELSETFNAMAAEIEQLMDKVYQEQRAKRKNQFIALQNQINPHFLYNTLDSILYLSEQGRREEVERMVTALSKFFRISITHESGLVPLKEEVEHAKHYLAIQQIRYQNSFEYTLDVEEGIEDHKVLKLSLQPLVENAIYHGIDETVDAKSRIEIHCHKKGDFIHIDVKNEGLGLSQEEIDAITKMYKEGEESRHIGLKNIYQRLRLYFGQKADLVIDSEMDYYTQVSIRIPLKEEGEDYA
ncbi:MAG: cache domain-containing sensor histidine kinase [Bacillota bacterium]